MFDLTTALLATLAASTSTPGPAQEQELRSHVEGFLPRAVTSFGAEAAGDYIYVMGGYFGAPHEYSHEGQSDAFYRINLHDLRDIETLPGAGRAQSLALVEHAGALVRVGGMVIDNAAGEDQRMRSIDTVARFDPLERTWTALPPLPEPRSSHECAVVAGHLYVAGGWKLGAGPPA